MGNQYKDIGENMRELKNMQGNTSKSSLKERAREIANKQ